MSTTVVGTTTRSSLHHFYRHGPPALHAQHALPRAYEQLRLQPLSG